MGKDKIAIKQERNSKTTRIKQSLIVLIGQTEQDDHVKKERAIKSLKIGVVEKGAIGTKNDWRKAETRVVESWAGGADSKGEVWDAEKGLRVIKKYSERKSSDIIEAAPAIVISAPEIVTAQTLTETKVTMLTERTVQSQIILNAETEVKVTPNPHPPPRTKGQINLITQTNLIKKKITQVIINQEISLIS